MYFLLQIISVPGLEFVQETTKVPVKKAIVVTGHKIIIAVYHILKNKEAYQQLELHKSEKQKTKQINRLIARLNEFG